MVFGGVGRGMGDWKTRVCGLARSWADNWDALLAVGECAVADRALMGGGLAAVWSDDAA